MGTTLTGTTPQDTYDSLIKVTDNGPIGATPKLLSDGLGNDSSLALSTSFTAVRGGQQLRVYRTDNATYGSIEYVAGGVGFKFDDVNGDGYRFAQGANARLVIDTSGNVGIGTSAPSQKLQVVGIVAAQIGIDGSDATGVRIYGSGTSKRVDFTAADGSVNERISGIGTGGVGIMTFSVNNNVGVLTERVRIQTDGGISFNGDTSQANALDDYEEGEWTMGISFGGNSVGAAYILNTGRYTKIGRQVTASGYLAMSAKGSSTGDAAITGLPFTSGNTYKAITSASLRLDSVSFANAFQAYVDGPSTAISLGEITEAGVASNLTNADFSDSSAVMVSVTYTV